MSILEYGENCLYLKGILDDQTPHILTPTSNLCLALDLYYLSSSSHHVGSNICKRSGSSVLSRTWQMTRSRIHFSRIPPTIQSTFFPPELYFIKFNKFDQIVLFTCTNWQYIISIASWLRKILYCIIVIYCVPVCVSSKLCLLELWLYI